MNYSDYSKVNLSFSSGIPDHDFFEKAWVSEPLTNNLTETNVPFALPEADEDLSLIAKHQGEIVGQCSTNQVVKYWNHVEKNDSSGQNLSTQIFLKIHMKAVQAEEKYLLKIGESIEKSFHNAGIAVLPDHRGKNIGLAMVAKQIELCREHGATTLFCETTNRFSAAIAGRFGFTKIVEYPYSKLADELNHANLNKLNDSFTVWCLKV